MKKPISLILFLFSCPYYLLAKHKKMLHQQKHLFLLKTLRKQYHP